MQLKAAHKLSAVKAHLAFGVSVCALIVCAHRECRLTAVINKLTNAALDPFTKIPEFKYCAIRMEQGGVAPMGTSFGGGQILAKRAEDVIAQPPAA